MPDVSFENLLAVGLVAALAPLLPDLAPRRLLPAIVLESPSAPSSASTRSDGSPTTPRRGRDADVV